MSRHGGAVDHVRLMPQLVTSLVTQHGRGRQLRRPQSSQVRSPHSHSNMWRRFPVLESTTVRTRF